MRLIGRLRLLRRVTDAICGGEEGAVTLVAFEHNGDRQSRDPWIEAL
jgi:hypothetical protein